MANPHEKMQAVVAQLVQQYGSPEEAAKVFAGHLHNINSAADMTFQQLGSSTRLGGNNQEESADILEKLKFMGLPAPNYAIGPRVPSQGPRKLNLSDFLSSLGR